jgi:hypothetical protein
LRQVVLRQVVFVFVFVFVFLFFVVIRYHHEWRISIHFNKELWHFNS